MKIQQKLRKLEEEASTLRRLEEEIPKLKGRAREEAMEAYRSLLLCLKDEPIYFVRS